MTLSEVKTEQERFLPVTVKGFLAAHPAVMTAQDGSIAVAVSGGPDSMALCWLLSQIAQRQGLEIHALTVDHGLRAEAAAEAAKVGGWLKDFPCVRHVVLTSPQALSPSSKVMESARDMRYGLFESYCRQYGISKLYVAHHQNDQAETFLFRLAKGSGLDGLAAMKEEQAYSDTLTLFRPLLGYSKESLIATCEANNVPYVLDPTNENDRFARARLRRSSAVLAEEGLSVKRLAVTAARINRGREALDIFAGRVFDTALQEMTDRTVVFDFDGLLEAPEEIRLRVIKKGMESLSGGLKKKQPYGPRTEKFEVLVFRLFTDDAFVSATLGGFLFVLDRKKSLLRLEIERKG